MPVRLNGDVLVRLVAEADLRQSNRQKLVAMLAAPFADGAPLARREQHRMLTNVLPKIAHAGRSLIAAEVIDLAYPTSRTSGDRTNNKIDNQPPLKAGAKRLPRLDASLLVQLGGDFLASEIDADLIHRFTGYGPITCRTYGAGLLKLLKNRRLVARLLARADEHMPPADCIDEARSILANRRSRAVSRKLTPDKVMVVAVAILKAIAETRGPLSVVRRARLAEWATDHCLLLPRTAERAVQQLAMKLIVDSALMREVQAAELSHQRPPELDARLMQIAGSPHRPKTDRHPTNAEFHRWYDQALNEISGGQGRSLRLNVGAVYDIYCKSRGRTGDQPLQKSAFYEAFKHWRGAQKGVLPTHGARDALIVGYTAAEKSDFKARLFLAVHEASGWMYAKWATGPDLHGDSWQPTLEHWIAAHNSMLLAFGRVPESIAHAPSSAATVIRYCRGQRPIKNVYYRQTYLSWAGHYGVAVPSSRPDRGPAKWPAIFLSAQDRLKEVLAGNHAVLAEAVRRANGAHPLRQGFMREDTVTYLPGDFFACGPWTEVRIRMDGFFVWKGDIYSLPRPDQRSSSDVQSEMLASSKTCFVREEGTASDAKLSAYPRIGAAEPLCQHRLLEPRLIQNQPQRVAMKREHLMSIGLQLSIAKHLVARAEPLGLAQLVTMAMGVSRKVQVSAFDHVETYQPLHYQDWNITLASLNRASIRTQSPGVWRASLERTIGELMDPARDRDRTWVHSVHQELRRCAKWQKPDIAFISLDTGELVAS